MKFIISFKYFFYLLIVSFIFLNFLIREIKAFEIIDLPGIEVSGDFVLSPSRVDLELEPGEEAEKELVILNRSGKILNLRFSIEDFSTNSKSDQDLIFFGEDIGPYSLKDYLNPEIYNISLQHGQKIILPVSIKIPKDSRSGGLYAGLVVSGNLSDNESDVKIVSRLISLFFIKIIGEFNEDGRVSNFFTDKKFYWSSPIEFGFVYDNNSNIHLNPYGKLSIFNLWGKSVYEKKILPYYIMPFSSRQHLEVWEGKKMFGIYKGVLEINRGYGNIVDIKTVYFFICSPVLLISLIIFMLLMMIVGYKYFSFIKK